MTSSVNGPEAAAASAGTPEVMDDLPWVEEGVKVAPRRRVRAVCP
ncbi:hypothetical protein ACFWP7_36780 [Streptomyces sp. NPDC058470]